MRDVNMIQNDEPSDKMKAMKQHRFEALVD